MRVSDVYRNIAVNDFTALIDSGLGAGNITFYTGAPPLETVDPAAGVALAQLSFADPAFIAAVLGSASANPITPVVAIDTGIVGHWRIRDFVGTVVAQGTAGVAASDIAVSSVNWTAGQTITINILSVIMPKDSCDD